MRTMQDKLEIGDLSNMTTYQAGALQASANRALRLFCNEVLRPYGITKKQWMVIGLALQAGAGGANCAEITRRLDMTPQSLNSMLTTLGKRKKLVSKICQNGQKTITVHPEFAPDCTEIERMLRIALRGSIYRDISPLEFRIYLKVLFFLSRLQPNKL